MNEPARNLSESSAARAQSSGALGVDSRHGEEAKTLPGASKMEIKAMVGLQSSVYRYSVTETALREFCEAVGARYRGEASPTFMTVFRIGEFELLREKMGIPLSAVLHADQEYRYETAILPGDEIDYQTALTRAFEKTGSSGSMRFFVFDTEVRFRRGEEAGVIGYCKTTLIVR